MQQNVKTLQANVERLDGETGQRQSFDRMEQAVPWTDPVDSKLDDLRRLAWLSVKLCNSFLHRWLNVCEVGVEEVFFALTMLRPFAGVNLDPMTAPQETASLHSRPLLEENSFLSPADSLDLSRSQPRLEISWRTPWLYLILLLLVWLLLF